MYFKTMLYILILRFACSKDSTKLFTERCALQAGALGTLEEWLVPCVRSTEGGGQLAGVLGALLLGETVLSLVTQAVRMGSPGL